MRPIACNTWGMADSRPDFPDFFGDSINVASGTYGVTLTFFASDPLRPDGDGMPGTVVGRARISPEMATALAKLLTEAVEKTAGVSTGNAKRRAS